MNPGAEHIQEEDESLDDIYEDTVPESTHSNDSSQNSSEQDEQEDREDKSGIFDLDGDPYGTESSTFKESEKEIVSRPPGRLVPWRNVPIHSF